MHKKYIILLFICFLLYSCFDLDANLFNNDNSLSGYMFGEYEGEVNFRLDESYKIPNELISLIQLESDDNGNKANIYAAFIGDMNTIHQDTIILYCHGNRSHMDHYWPRVELLANIGGKNRFGIMTLDYRGYGMSEGEPTETGMYADVDAALQWLKAMGLTDDRLIIYGFSLGSAPATKLSAEPRAMMPSKLILENPFASAEVMVQDATGLALPGSFFTNNKIENAEYIKNVQQPFLWLHGENDDFLSIKTHGEVVWKNYTGISGTAARIQEANHVNLPEVMGFDHYLRLILQFLES